ncbi:helix-turn-helix domain-containing protein [Asanoa sp. WMMD1127]|uniref:winged helix-turn-helix transcriptional regulator n=1 Tax=Asanoa sp. WMMD1127 TaxID=3016107 RepID=UPI00241630D4|nr:helix-turn-helix domain-containing protein [Asanoa sp. WMMD1127]MDG4825090.1 helix-turn-helix domain-containing protein [Asanoa sp. WMMD1127]
MLGGAHVRFEDLKRDLGISRKVLAERLGRLLEKEILRRHQYSDRPPRFEYLLTEKGLDLCAVLLAAMAWGDRWTAGPAGPPVLLRHQACGEMTHAVLRCAGCGQPLDATDVGPRRRHAVAPSGIEIWRSGGDNLPLACPGSHNSVVWRAGRRSRLARRGRQCNGFGSSWSTWVSPSQLALGSCQPPWWAVRRCASSGPHVPGS